MRIDSITLTSDLDEVRVPRAYSRVIVQNGEIPVYLMSHPSKGKLLLGSHERVEFSLKYVTDSVNGEELLGRVKKFFIGTIYNTENNDVVVDLLWTT